MQINKKNIFISHSNKDKELATELASLLKEIYYQDEITNKVKELHCSSDLWQGQTDKRRIIKFLDKTNTFVQIITSNSLKSTSVAYERGYYDYILERDDDDKNQLITVSCGVTHLDNELFTNTSYINDIALEKEEFCKNFISCLDGLKNKDMIIPKLKKVIYNQFNRMFELKYNNNNRILKLKDNYNISESYFRKLESLNFISKYENNALYLTSEGEKKFIPKMPSP